MGKVLFINACVRPGSRTLELAETLLQKLKGDAEEVRLYERPLPVLDLTAMERRNLAAQKGDFSNSVFPMLRRWQKISSASRNFTATPRRGWMFSVPMWMGYRRRIS